ncbi:MAG: lipid-A-disaccharide synthase N-terminal domain-containing protein [Deltaproteobacteria bacterium]|nr:lipid-A-disaccharide synthase N-terminal domain-containing protein [Deltaproteobacteria bacterium]
MPAFLDPATWTLWTAIGFLGQGMFFSRFAVQWLVSERRGESHVPVAFWWLSLAGSLVTLAYAIHRGDPVFVLGQAFGWMVYSRNLVLIYRGRGAE